MPRRKNPNAVMGRPTSYPGKETSAPLNVYLTAEGWARLEMTRHRLKYADGHIPSRSDLIEHLLVHASEALPRLPVRHGKSALEQSTAEFQTYVAPVALAEEVDGIEVVPPVESVQARMERALREFKTFMPPVLPDETEDA